MVTIYDVKYPSQLSQIVSKTPETKLTLVFFIADTDVESGWSWCSDTFLAFPLVNQRVKELRHPTVMVRVHCGNRSEWRNPNNPFHFEPYNITSVPTLAVWRRGQESGRRLVEAEVYDKEKLQAFMKMAVSSQTNTM